MALDPADYIFSGVVAVASVTGYMVWQKRVSSNRKPAPGRLGAIALLVVVTAIFGISLTLLERVVGADSLFFASIVIFVAMGWAAFLQPVIRFRVPGAIRKIRPWERRGVAYRTLGVPGFGAILRRSPLRHLSPLVYLRMFPHEPAMLCRHLETTEASHFWGGLLTLPYLLYASLHGWWEVCLLSMVLHLGGNLYPIWHLRWVRIRLTRYVDRKALGQKMTNDRNV